MTNILDDIKEIELYRISHRIIDGEVDEKSQKITENNITFFCEYSLPFNIYNLGEEIYVIRQQNNKIQLYHIKDCEKIECNKCNKSHSKFIIDNYFRYFVGGITAGVCIGIYASKYVRKFWK